MNVRAVLARLPVIGSVLRFAFRARVAAGYYFRPLLSLVQWLFRSRETTNFTYDITEANKRYLAATIGHVTSKPYGEILTFVEELEADVELQTHIAAVVGRSPQKHVADQIARFGRRLGWYAFARAVKPRTIVETGVDKGLGACVLTRALMRNADEGFAGYYYGTDISPDAGYLLVGPYRDYGSILYGDSVESLTKLKGTIDLFINDSDHAVDYEMLEYETIAPKLSSQAIILSDNSHVTEALLDFSLRTNRQFIFFREQPYKHWYQGAGIGISFRRSTDHRL